MCVKGILPPAFSIMTRNDFGDIFGSNHHWYSLVSLETKYLRFQEDQIGRKEVKV